VRIEPSDLVEIAQSQPAITDHKEEKTGSRRHGRSGLKNLPQRHSKQKLRSSRAGARDLPPRIRQRNRSKLRGDHQEGGKKKQGKQKTIRKQED